MSLEKEFVPYEQSLALKELGFDEPCFAFYNGKFIQSTEFGVKLEAQNPWLTPYVRGAYDINLEQAGVGAGVYHTFGLPFGFKATPSAEFVKFERYDAVTAKLNVSRPIGNFVPYAEVGVTVLVGVLVGVTVFVGVL